MNAALTQRASHRSAAAEQQVQEEHERLTSTSTGLLCYQKYHSEELITIRDATFTENWIHAVRQTAIDRYKP